MSKSTGIAWCTATWNPWRGCTKVSPGCAHCFMFRDQQRYGNDPATVVRSKTTFRDPLKWKEPELIFTCSWSDWFHQDADAWRDEAWQIIRDTPQHTYQILTKRPERMREHLPADWGSGYPNVWLGVSVENQRHTMRAEILTQTPAALRFISAEPLLGPLTLTPWFLAGAGGSPKTDWLIVGGESGPDARAMKIEWARTLRDECAQYGVGYFLKQLGGYPDARAKDKAVLDGRTHTEIPAWGPVVSP